MNNKYYILGLGSGIILCSLIVYIALLLTKTQVPEFTDEYIVERAVQLGMVMPSVEEDKENLNLEENRDITEKDSINSNDEINENIDTVEDNTTNVDEKNYEVVSEEEVYVTFVVKAGNSSYQVSKTLFEKGLIDDENAFNQYLINNNINTKIRTGTYRIKKDSSYGEIAGYLTGS